MGDMAAISLVQSPASFETVVARPVANDSWEMWKRRWEYLGPAMLLTVGALDLALTVSAFESGTLVELNPIAAFVLALGGSAALAVYRLVMTVTGCVLLSWGLRMYRLQRFVGSNRQRIRRMMWASQITLIASHAGLVAWWIAWFTI
jgi:hypothetical protein